MREVFHEVERLSLYLYILGSGCLGHFQIKKSNHG